MFSKAIIKTDSFLDMPQTAQNLYFHLGMEADDDGFVSPKMVMRTLGSNDDDLKVLKAKNFVIPFESGVIVIRHWRQNNYIQSDRYQPTVYQDEFKIACEDNVYKLDTQVRLGKVRLGNNNSEKKSFSPKTKTNVELLVDFFFELKGWDGQSPEFYKEEGIVYGRFAKDAKDLLEVCDGNLEAAKMKLEKVGKWHEERGLEDWLLGTAVKKFLEIV